MTVLVFNHEGYEVATSSWSAASRDGKSVTVCYEWGPDRISWLSSAAVITARVTFYISMDQFLSAVRNAGSGILDLRTRK